MDEFTKSVNRVKRGLNPHMQYPACLTATSELNTIVTTHKNTDFDGMASMMAAIILYPDAEALVPKPINPNVKAFLSLHKDLFPWLEKPSPDLNAAERLVVVDTALDGRCRFAQTVRSGDFNLGSSSPSHHRRSLEMLRPCRRKYYIDAPLP